MTELMEDRPLAALHGMLTVGDANSCGHAFAGEPCTQPLHMIANSKRHYMNPPVNFYGAVLLVAALLTLRFRKVDLHAYRGRSDQDQGHDRASAESQASCVKG